MNLVWLLLLAAVAAVYFPGLHGGFLFDDYPNIVDNPAVHLSSFSLAGLQTSLGGLSAGPLGRPLSVWSFALTHLAFGLDPLAFKAINLVIHLVNGVLVGRLVALLLCMMPPRSDAANMLRWLPLAVGAAWLLHPIHFVAINMAVQRMTLLAACFTLLALIAHLQAVATPTDRSSRWGWAFVGWGVCWPLAVLAKETGLLVPAFALLITLFADCGQEQAGSIRRRIIAAMFGAIVVAALFMSWRIGWTWLEAGYAMRDFGPGERLMTEARVLWFYLAQTLLPSQANFAIYLDWIKVSRGPLDPVTTLPALIAWSVVVGATLFWWKRLPVIAFGMAWFLVGHSLESSIVPLEIAHEHRNYLPSLGPLFAVAYSIASVLGRMKPQPGRAVPITVALAALFLLATLTTLRSLQVANPLVGSQIEATRHDSSARANYVAGWTLIKAGLGDRDDPMAGTNIRFYFEQAERVDDGFKLGYLSLITWACASGREIEREWLDAFSTRLRTTVYSYGQQYLSSYLLRPLTAMPGCLNNSDALGLFEAGSQNQRISKGIRARFLEAAGDYALLVMQDPGLSKKYYKDSEVLDPTGSSLRSKLNNISPQK